MLSKEYETLNRIFLKLCNEVESIIGNPELRSTSFPTIWIRGALHQAHQASIIHRQNHWPIFLIFLYKILQNYHQLNKMQLAVVIYIYFLLSIYLYCNFPYSIPGIFQVGRNYFLFHHERSYTQRVERFLEACNLALQNITPSRSFSNRIINRSTEEAILRGIFCLEYRVIDCVGISGLALLQLSTSELSQSIRIERIATQYGYLFSHSFLIINRNHQTDIHNPHSWNQDTFIFDPWYGIFISAAEINSNSNFFKRYPMLSMASANITYTIDENNRHDFQFLMQQIMNEYQVPLFSI